MTITTSSAVDQAIHLNQLFTQVFERFQEQTAFSHAGASISFRELDLYSRRFAAALQQHTDLKPGDRIAIQLPNLIQYPVVLIGALRAGLVVVNTNPLYTETELLQQLTDSGARALVAFTPLFRQLQLDLGSTQVRWTLLTEAGDMHPPLSCWVINHWFRWFHDGSGQCQGCETLSLRALLNCTDASHWQPVEAQADDLALLQYTGGTTGTPRGAMLTHANLLANLRQLMPLLSRFTRAGEERLLQPLPVYHVYAFILTLAFFTIGSRTELIPDPRDTQQLIRRFRRVRPSLFAGINPLFSALLRHDDFDRLDFSRLHLTISGGMALNETLAHEWAQVTGCEIAEGYGLTECSPVVSVNHPDRIDYSSAGPLLPDTEVRITDEQGVTLPPGATGIIRVRGPQVMQGYWQQADSTAEVLDAEGWLDTGDIGQLSEAGHLRIIDRSKDVICVSGFKVYPAEIEKVVNRLEGVENCAAIGLPDEKQGEKIKLFVISHNPALTPQLIRDYCRERLTGYKVPKCIEFCDSLPRSPVGKVLRRVLRDRALEGTTPDGASRSRVRSPHD